MSSRSGVTLIELIMAIVVLGVALPGVLFLFVQVMGDAHDAPPMTTATYLAQEKLESVRAGLADPAIGYAGLTAAAFPDEAAVAGFPNFARSVTFVEVAASDLTTAQPGSGYKKVTVQVDWNGGQRSVVLTSMVTSP
jgi:prepilin-type N-terminal cleavage/methylation domain-containing protein